MEGRIQTFPGLGTGILFILTTDWSKENNARVLSLEQDGPEWFLGCSKRKHGSTSSGQ